MDSHSSRLSKAMMLESGFGRSGRDAYKPVFGFFGLEENPFHGGPDLRYLSFTREIRDAFAALTNGIQARLGLMVITGEAGTGKTILNNYLLSWLRERKEPTSYLVNSRLNPADFYDCITASFGIAQDATLEDKKSALVAWLLQCQERGRIPVLIVDEAQALPVSTLEEIGLLLDLDSSRQKLLQIVLVGQPELAQKLARQELRRLNERVAVRCRIGPLSSAETRKFIQQRLQVAGSRGDFVFAPEALDSVHAYSRGIPRLINLLCEHALLNAYADEIRPVPSPIVKEIARNFQFDHIGSWGGPPDFDEIKSIGALAAPAASTIAPVVVLETEESAPADLRNEPAVPAAILVVDEKPAPDPGTRVAGLAPPAPPVGTNNWVHQAAAFRRWMARPLWAEARSAVGELWRSNHLSAIQVPGWLRVPPALVRWLLQPAVSRHAPIRNFNRQIREKLRQRLERF